MKESSGGPRVSFRDAVADDLRSIVELLADDPLGQGRERATDPLPPAYGRALEAILADPHNVLIIAERNGSLVGVLQLTFIPNLTYEGSWRGLVEGVRVAPSARGEGVGRALVGEAIQRATTWGCRLIQLTTDKRRPDALAFYRSMGFEASHEGLKMRLEH